MTHGTPIECTLWSVEYRFRDPDHEPREELPGLRGRMIATQLPVDSDWKTGKTLIATADPTGSDLLDVAERVVQRLQVCRVRDFNLISAMRMADSLQGTGIVRGASS